MAKFSPLLDQLLRPTSLCMLVLVPASLALAGAQQDALSWSYIMGAAPVFDAGSVGSANPERFSGRIALHATACFAIAMGMYVSTVLAGWQSATITWTQPAIRRKLVRDLLLLPLAVALVIALWCVRWVDAAHLTRVVLLVPWWFGLIASMAHIGHVVRSPLIFPLVTYAAVFGLVYSAGPFFRFVDHVGILSAALLGVVGLLLLWRSCQADVHRQLVLWRYAGGPRGGKAEGVHPIRSAATNGGLVERGVSWWLGTFDRERKGRRTLRWVGVPAVVQWDMSNGLYVALVLHFVQLPMLYLLGLQNIGRGPTANYPLLYPISRRQRTQAHYIDDVRSMLVTVAAFSAFSALLTALDVPIPAYFSDSFSRLREPIAVQAAAVLCFFPIMQVARAYAPLYRPPSEMQGVQAKVLFLTLGLMVPFSLAVMFAARHVWSSTHQQLLPTVSLFVSGAVVMQVAAYVHLRYVFSKRDLTA